MAPSHDLVEKPSFIEWTRSRGVANGALLPDVLLSFSDLPIPLPISPFSSPVSIALEWTDSLSPRQTRSLNHQAAGDTHQFATPLAGWQIDNAGRQKASQRE